MSDNSIQSFMVYDSKGKEYELNCKIRDIGRLWYLDKKRIVVDDHYGWIFPDPNSYKLKPVRDSVLRDNIDTVVFGRTIPTGDDEEDDE